MTRAASLVPLTAMILAACGGATQPEPQQPLVRVDTVTITREVPPPLPHGTPTTVCLASGQDIEVRVSAAGDTLVGPQRVPLADLGPAIGFVGNYAADESWFARDQPVTVQRRPFSRFGQPQAHDCQDMKIIGDFNGVNVFAERTAAEPFQTVYVPVRPGVFQAYQAEVGRVRG